MRKTLMITYRTLIIPVGVPLMGKSTWMRSKLPPIVVRISRDELRRSVSIPVRMGDGVFYETLTDPDMEDLLEKVYIYAIRWNMLRQNPVVADATNLTFRGRAKLKRIARQHGYVPITVVFEKREPIRQAIVEDGQLVQQRSRDIYNLSRTALRQGLRDIGDGLRDMGIKTQLMLTLLRRNYFRFRKRGIFINPRVLVPMLKRMLRDYPRDAILSSRIERVVVGEMPSRCSGTLSKCHKFTPLRLKVYRMIKPAMEGKEW
jgi:predicted kinase